MQRIKEEYWEPGEIRSRKSQLEMVVKLYEQMFGPNGPQTEEELDEIPDAQTRYNEWKALQKTGSSSMSPSYDIIDSGQPFDIFNVVTDRASFEKFQAKKPPLAYWVEMRKGRIAWLEKYVPIISHKDKYRVYFNTPDGALERVPAWATYVLPGLPTSLCIHVTYLLILIEEVVQCRLKVALIDLHRTSSKCNRVMFCCWVVTPVFYLTGC
jgi:1,4-alpha-glucan branching enzyme